LIAADHPFGILDASAGPELVAAHIASHAVQPVLVQFACFGPEAISFLDMVRGISPYAPVIVILKSPSLRDATSFIRHGVFECLGPDAVADNLANALQSALDHCTQRRSLETALDSEPWRRSLVGQSSALTQVAKLISLVAPRRCTVLITGETGTGKEMVARAIHQAGSRTRRPMVSINCSALPENLVEAELFGHVKGAFTGADGNRIGRFEQADGGTLFLDEIGDFPIHLQAKLLRVLQERELQRLGGTETIKVDVRVIAATNVNLLERVRQGTFREDLYYRLNVVPIYMPLLRERVSDIPLLVNHFVRKVCLAEGLTVKFVSAGAMSQICAYAWPGNVRQLENIVEQAVVMNASRDSLEASAFSLPGAPPQTYGNASPGPTRSIPDEGIDFGEILRRFERGILDQALVRTQGNRTLAAELLRLPRTTLVNKLRALAMVA